MKSGYCIHAIKSNHHDIFERIKTSIVGCLNSEKKITTVFGILVKSVIVKIECF